MTYPVVVVMDTTWKIAWRNDSSNGNLSLCHRKIKIRMVNIKKKFTRRGTRRHSKLGRGKKSKQKWRKPKGRDNKMRENKKSRPPVVSVGYRKPKEDRGKIENEGKRPVRVENLKEAEQVEKNDLVIIASVGKKKRLAIEEKIKEKDADIYNDKESINRKGKKSKSKSKSKSKKKSGKGKSKKKSGSKKKKSGKKSGKKESKKQSKSKKKAEKGKKKDKSEDEDEGVKCDICGKVLKSERGLKMHKSRSHSENDEDEEE